MKISLFLSDKDLTNYEGEFRGKNVRMFWRLLSHILGCGVDFWNDSQFGMRFEVGLLRSSVE
jgi:hypothetical protein